MEEVACPACKKINDGSSRTCVLCGSSLPTGLWPCSKCTYLNKTEDKKCDICGWYRYQVPRDWADSSTQSLPPGWEIHFDQHHQLYFVDHNTRSTSWTDPRHRARTREQQSSGTAIGNVGGHKDHSLHDVRGENLTSGKSDTEYISGGTKGRNQLQYQHQQHQRKDPLRIARPLIKAPGHVSFSTLGASVSSRKKEGQGHIGIPKPSVTDPTQTSIPESTFSAPSPSHPAVLIAQSPARWTCFLCNTRNPGKARVCSMCKTQPLHTAARGHSRAHTPASSLPVAAPSHSPPTPSTVSSTPLHRVRVPSRLEQSHRSLRQSNVVMRHRNQNHPNVHVGTHTVSVRADDSKSSSSRDIKGHIGTHTNASGKHMSQGCSGTDRIYINGAQDQQQHQHQHQHQHYQHDHQHHHHQQQQQQQRQQYEQQCEQQQQQKQAIDLLRRAEEFRNQRRKETPKPKQEPKTNPPSPSPSHTESEALAHAQPRASREAKRKEKEHLTPQLDDHSTHEQVTAEAHGQAPKPVHTHTYTHTHTHTRTRTRTRTRARAQPYAPVRSQSQTQLPTSASARTQARPDCGSTSVVARGGSQGRRGKERERRYTGEAWLCEWCTFLNERATMSCIICSNTYNTRPELHQWQCRKCTFLNAEDAHRCTVCNALQPKAMRAKKKEKKKKQRTKNTTRLVKQTKGTTGGGQDTATAPAAAAAAVAAAATSDTHGDEGGEDSESEEDDEEAEEILGRVFCSMVTPLYEYDGIMTVSSSHLTFFGLLSEHNMHTDEPVDRQIIEEEAYRDGKEDKDKDEDGRKDSDDVCSVPVTGDDVKVKEKGEGKEKEKEKATANNAFDHDKDGDKGNTNDADNDGHTNDHNDVGADDDGDDDDDDDAGNARPDADSGDVVDEVDQLASFFSSPEKTNDSTKPTDTGSDISHVGDTNGERDHDKKIQDSLPKALASSSSSSSSSSSPSSSSSSSSSSPSPSSPTIDQEKQVRIPLAHIRSILPRCYMIRPTALEIFTYGTFTGDGFNAGSDSDSDSGSGRNQGCDARGEALHRYSDSSIGRLPRGTSAGEGVCNQASVHDCKHAPPPSSSSSMTNLQSEYYTSPSYFFHFGFGSEPRQRDTRHRKDEQQKERNRVFKLLCKLTNFPFCLDPLELFQLPHNRQVTDRWRKGKVSNFEYLLHLNALAGRSVNDLTQFPVMPWVLTDYHSSTIDLRDEKVYRDLSKPIGRLNPDKWTVNQQRYEAFKQEQEALAADHRRRMEAEEQERRSRRRTRSSSSRSNHSNNSKSKCNDHTSSDRGGGGGGSRDGERTSRGSRHCSAPNIIPPFHYGSHYSSAAIVLYYLVRQGPYTGLAKSLQGGHFDLADRLFSDIGAAWHLSFTNISDVKELIPQFFCSPRFLRNEDHLQLGCRQDGTTVNHVVLPPWAESPEDFVRIHRAALESEYVSSHLHHWIDLIFGFKQRGREAEKAGNVFFYLTYAENVDIDSIQDPVIRKATEDQIAHFGQTPSQLLCTFPHVPRYYNDSDNDHHSHSSDSAPRVSGVTASASSSSSSSSSALSGRHGGGEGGTGEGVGVAVGSVAAVTGFIGDLINTHAPPVVAEGLGQAATRGKTIIKGGVNRFLAITTVFRKSE